MKFCVMNICVKQDEVERVTVTCAWGKIKLKGLPLHEPETRWSWKAYTYMSVQHAEVRLTPTCVWSEMKLKDLYLHEREGR